MFELLSFSYDHNTPDMECNGVLSTEEYRLLVGNWDGEGFQVKQLASASTWCGLHNNNGFIMGGESCVPVTEMALGKLCPAFVS